MSDGTDPDRDLIDRLLAAPPASTGEALRQPVFARTARVLRRRRLARRLAGAVAFAACYAAGVLSARWLTPAPRPVERIVTVERPRSPERPPPERPGALERQARADAARRSALYRRAGDLYATEQGDLQAALRCYGQSLDTAPTKDLAIAASDHWLLMAIKDAREKEKVHAQEKH